MLFMNIAEIPPVTVRNKSLQLEAEYKDCYGIYSNELL